MHIAVVGLSHRTAPVETREKLSIPEQSIENSLKALKGAEQVLEVSILSTCNRLEIYSLVKHQDLGVSAIKQFLCDYSGLSNEDLNIWVEDYANSNSKNGTFTSQQSV